MWPYPGYPLPQTGGVTPTPSPTPAPSIPAPTFTNPPDWVPCIGDRVRVHWLPGDAWTPERYAQEQITNGQEATIGGGRGAGLLAVHFTAPKGRITGLVVAVEALEYVQ